MTLRAQTPRPSPALDALLAGYAAGALPAPLHALVGSHLELSAVNRAYVGALESSLASEVLRQEPAPVGAREARLAAIFASEAPSGPKLAAVNPPAINHPAMPDPKALRHFLGGTIDAQRFRSVLPGLRECRIEGGEGMQAMLYRIRGGRKLPKHTHDGAEITLVLRGGFSDGREHFTRGDIALSDEHTDHVPVADPDVECVCFAVLDAPLRLTGLLGRLVNPFLRH